jgi:hypothetical protein
MFKWTKPKIARLKDLYQEGYSHKIIRTEIGCQHTELSQKIKELGLKREKV